MFCFLLLAVLLPCASCSPGSRRQVDAAVSVDDVILLLVEKLGHLLPGLILSQDAGDPCSYNLLGNDTATEWTSEALPAFINAARAMRHVQCGTCNAARAMRHVQCGTCNAARAMRHVQCGTCNAARAMRHVQCGTCNAARAMRHVQCGTCNAARAMRHVQCGTCNAARAMRHVQCGTCNAARAMRHVQCGTCNAARDVFLFGSLCVVLDATGKINSNMKNAMESGLVQWLGDYDECRSVDSAHYCSLQILTVVIVYKNKVFVFPPLCLSRYSCLSRSVRLFSIELFVCLSACL